MQLLSSSHIVGSEACLLLASIKGPMWIIWGPFTGDASGQPSSSGNELMSSQSRAADRAKTRSQNLNLDFWEAEFPTSQGKSLVLSFGLVDGDLSSSSSSGFSFVR